MSNFGYFYFGHYCFTIFNKNCEAFDFKINQC